VKAIVEGQLAIILTVGVNHEKIPVFRMIAAIDDRPTGAKSPLTPSQSSGSDLPGIVGIAGGR